jgi:signal transduction histidine kinase
LRLTGSLSKRSAGFLVALAVVAAAFSLASFEFSSAVSTNISNLSVANVNANAQIQSSDLSHLLSQTLGGISENLQIIAASPAVTSGNLTSSQLLFTSAQNSTRDLTTSYFWMNSNGTLLLVSNGTLATYSNGTGKNLSQRPFFLAPRASGSTYFSSATPSLSNSSKIYIFISQPVYSAGIFDGVVSAAINLVTLGSFLKSQLAPSFQSSIGILDFNGTVLYTSQVSLIGQNVFGSVFQNELPAALKPTFNSFLHESLVGQAGVDDISYNGASGTLAYEPIDVNDSSGNVHQFGVLYITAADAVSASATALINQQRLVSTAIIVGVGATFFATAFMILRWNKRLGDAVNDKTKELVQTNLQLSAANEQLGAQSKAQTDLINIAAHELRTPTQSILANAELLRGAIVLQPMSVSPAPSIGSVIEPGKDFLSFPNIPQEDVVELVESTFRNAMRLERLTQTLLEVARIDNRTIRLDYETFDLNELIRQLIPDVQKGSSLNSAVSPRYPEIHLDSADPELVITADKTKVGQIVSNLLSNSIKSSKNGGKIVVSTRKNQDSVVVSVKDEGKGIDQVIMPRLFNKFTTDSGTGLGLFITKSYVEAQGGTITAENNKDGNGATFTFTLPIHPNLNDDPEKKSD